MCSVLSSRHTQIFGKKTLKHIVMLTLFLLGEFSGYNIKFSVGLLILISSQREEPLNTVQ